MTHHSILRSVYAMALLTFSAWLRTFAWRVSPPPAARVCNA